MPIQFPCQNPPAAASAPVQQLPAEIQLDVFSRLPAADLAQVQQTCQRWGFLSEDPILWRACVRHEQPLMPQVPAANETWQTLFARNTEVGRAWLNEPWAESKAARNTEVYCRGLWRTGTVTGMWSFSAVSAWPSDRRAGAQERFNLNVDGCQAACPFGERNVALVTRHHRVEHRDLTTGLSRWSAPGRASEAHAALTLDDTRFAVAYNDGAIDVWETGINTPSLTLQGHTARVNCLTLLRDGRLLSGASDHTARVWNLDTGTCELELRGHRDYVKNVLLLQENKIVTTSRDGTIAIWDAQSGTLLHHLGVDSILVYALCELPGGILATGDCDGGIKLWDIASGERLRAFSSGNHCVRQMTLVEPTQILALTDGGGPVFFNVG